MPDARRHLQTGDHVKQNCAKAASPYKKGCDGGEPASCNFLGTMYLNGHGIKKDIKQAMNLFTKSCDLEAPVGCYSLGEMYISGTSAKQDFSKVKAYFGKACDLEKKTVPAGDLSCSRYNELAGNPETEGRAQ